MNQANEVYHRLLERFGPQGWWPAETSFEMMVGAILAPQTSWKKVEIAIRNLRRAKVLGPAKIAAMSLPTLTDLIRPAGLHNTKPRRLRDFSRHLVRTSGGDARMFLRKDPRSLRSELLSLEGIGPETADSILLYAAEVPKFVVDAYTRRMGTRVGLFDCDDYDEVQRFFETNVTLDVKIYQEYHALIVELAKKVCRPRPLCKDCPLGDVCDHARSPRQTRVRQS